MDLLTLPCSPYHGEQNHLSMVSLLSTGLNNVTSVPIYRPPSLSTLLYKPSKFIVWFRGPCLSLVVPGKSLMKTKIQN